VSAYIRIKILYNQLDSILCYIKALWVVLPFASTALSALPLVIKENIIYILLFILEIYIFNVAMDNLKIYFNSNIYKFIMQLFSLFFSFRVNKKFSRFYFFE
jgi:hypothetical protein